MLAASQPSYRFAVLLRLRFRSGTYQCGGTLVAPDVVLTAAHCLAEDPRAYLNPNDTALHGVTALLNWLDTVHYNESAAAPPASEPLAEVITAARWTWHERYDPAGGGAGGVVNAHDVGLLWLRTPSVHGAVVTLDFPGLLAYREQEAASAGGSVLALGWGLTRALRVEDDATGAVATRLQRVKLVLAPGQYCDAQATANANLYDDTRQVCASTDGGVDTCYVRAVLHALCAARAGAALTWLLRAQGDSGGPLLSIAEGGDGWQPGVQFAIVRRGRCCYNLRLRILC